jgi:hypothetical protein
VTSFDERVEALLDAIESRPGHIVRVGEFAIRFVLDDLGVIELFTDGPDDRLMVLARDIVIAGETEEQRRARLLTLGRIARLITSDDAEVIDPYGVFAATGVAS